MLGFAVIDHQPGDGLTAVWLTTRVALDHAGHTNAVCVTDDDPERTRKLRSLTADRVVILTAGSEQPLTFVTPFGVEIVGSLIAETTDYQDQIIAAVEAYATKSRNRNLVRPEFPAAPPVPEISEMIGAAQRALATANYIERAWSAWLTTDDQRRRRTVDPRKGIAPWIMPDALNSPDIAEFPPSFAAQVRSEPIA